MADSGVTVVVTGAASEVGRDLRAAMVERAFPVSQWRLYDDAQAILELAEQDESIAVRPIDEADYDDAHIVFLCGPPEQSRVAAAAAQDAGAIAVDLTQTLIEDDGVAVIVPEVNSAAVELAVDEQAIATPLPAVTALAVALNPFEERARLRRVAVTAFEPVSSTPGGIAELARQTGDLLSGREPKAKLWGSRIAFNLIPQVGALVATGATQREWQIQSQLRKVLDLPDLPISVHVVRVPTFYGIGLTVDVETDEPLDTESAVALLRQAPGVQVHEGESESANYPTLSDAVGSEATHVGRVREDPTVPCGATFWLAIDGLRKGTTVNAAQIAECIVRELRSRG